jgi:2-amino-4-hydroxy-6-hydroxymethyldihydropteridine diphosphokinase
MELIGNNRVVIAFGSNLGDKAQNIQQALAQINETCGKVVQVSSFHRSEPMGFDSNNEFLNGCLLLLTDLPPKNLLRHLKEIEVSMGRVKTSENYEDRLIDLDIILYENLCVNTPELQIPHPKYQERAFVLEPLMELDLGFSPF